MDRGCNRLRNCKHFFPVILACSSPSSRCPALPLAAVFHWCSPLGCAAPDPTLSLLALALAWALSAASHIAVVRGHAWGVRGLVGLNGLAVLATLPSYAFRPHMGAYVSVLLFGLLALLVINSQRYREMRVRLVGYREIRRANRQAAKAGK